MDGSLKIQHGAYMPKWIIDKSIYHVRFRLADSLPHTKREEIKEERRHLQHRLKSKNIPLTHDEHFIRKKILSDHTEKLLHNGAGACYLEQPEIATLVQDAIRFYSDIRYELHTWCIMPNHVHIIVEPFPSFDLSAIVHSWKSFTSNKANNALNRSGAFWSRDYYSRIIRDHQEYQAQMRYVWNNPEQIGRPNWPWRWVRQD